MLISSKIFSKSKNLLLFILLMFSFHAYAAQYSGEAYGESLEQAKALSRAALSESLWVEIKSEFSSFSDSSGKNKASQKLYSFSELPLLGAQSECLQKKDNDYFCQTFLDSDRAFNIYQKEAKALEKQIRSLHLKSKDNKLSDRIQYKVLSDLLLSYEKYQQYLRVMRLMNKEYKASNLIDISSIQNNLLALEKTIKDLNIVASVIQRGLPDLSYFIFPPTPSGSSQATQFSQVLKDRLQEKIKSVDSIEKSGAYLKGHYQLTDNGLLLTYQAFNKEGVILATRLVKIHPEAYATLKFKAQNVNFEKLLHEGYIVSNEFKAELSTNHGKENLLFSTGEEIELFVKLNQSGYFYIVSHNMDNNFSYLLEMNDAPGRRAFISFVNADDANRWISLGKFEVVPPFGIEHLQLIASNIDLIEKLPGTAFDTDSSLYQVVSKSAQDAVIQTRALKPVNRKKQKSSESTLTYTTAQSQ